MAERLTTFAIGEIAVYINPDSRFYGQECTIASNLIHGPVYTRPGSTEIVGRAGYKIEAPWLPRDPRVNFWVAQPQFLKKRPPKQDWNKMCNLTEDKSLAPV